VLDFNLTGFSLKDIVEQVAIEVLAELLKEGVQFLLGSRPRRPGEDVPQVACVFNA
jgi:hypothetical protein